MLFYNIGIFFYGLFLKTAALFHPKAKLWINGRKNIFDKIEKTIKEKNVSGNLIWFHCASLGEFEQGRPVIEALKKNSANTKIILTFFSPSGYEIRKDYNLADAVFYLPLDTKANTRKFISIVKPSKVVFVKYEFWLNYIRELKKQNTPTYLISAVFRPNQHFFKWYGQLFFNTLLFYKKIFVQDESSFQLLKQSGLANIQIAGDTRFDRVLEISETIKDLPVINAFCAGSKIIVAGSTWAKDEEILVSAFKKLKEKYSDLKLMIAPHDVNKHTVSRIEKLAGRNFTHYTNPNNIEKSDVLIIDTIGILSQIYRYGFVAYIGGGFNDGIHNILEAMVYNIPAAFGTNNKNFIEAQEALKLNIATQVTTESDLYAYFDTLLSSEEKQKQLAEEIKKYMQSKMGATKEIIAELLST